MNGKLLVSAINFIIFPCMFCAPVTIFFFDQAKALQAYSDGQREGDNKDMQLSTLAKVRNKKRSSFYIATACNNLTERRIVVKFIFNER